MKKVLFVATVGDKHINTFHIPYLKLLKKEGYQIHVSAKNDLEPKDIHIEFCDCFFDTPYNRNPFSFQNLFAYRKLINILNNNDYDFIHTHTPISSAIVRLIKMRKKYRKIKIIYTAHGFHFYKGSSILNWLLYYPLEKILSFFTDVLITINEEDYNLAKNHNFKSNKIVKTNGIGVNLSKFSPVTCEEKKNLREKLNINQEDFILIYPAELNSNKNQKVLIEAIEVLSKKYSNIKLILLGTGDNEIFYKNMALIKKIEDKIIFTGFVHNVSEYLNSSDLLVASSLREGLPLNLIEAMACGLPVIASKNRGHSELIKNNYNGFLLDTISSNDFAKGIEKLYFNKEIINSFKNNNLKDSKKYSINLVLDKVKVVYEEISQK